MKQNYKELKKSLMDGYLAEMRKANCNDDAYYRKDAGQIVKLSNGGYFVVGKSRMQTHFCFGYNTDYTGHEQFDAERTRAAFAKSATAFKNANLRAIDATIEALERGEMEWNRVPVLVRESYYGQSEPLNVYELSWERLSTIIERHGGSATQAEIDADCASQEDRAIMLGAYRAEREGFSKRLDTYLKKYGTSKLHTWTYWRDE